MSDVDQGHENLMKDLSELFGEAIEGEFGDFTNSKYETPKVALIKRLGVLSSLAQSGRYDNLK